MSEGEREKPSRWQRVKGFFGGGQDQSRTHQAFTRLKVEGGFTNLFNIDDVEARRGEIVDILQSIESDRLELYCKKDKQGRILKRWGRRPTAKELKSFKESVNVRVYSLFMTVGSPWYRGLDDRELAEKVERFLWLWNYAGDLHAFVDDIYMCAMQLVNLSWKALDVTNTPPYIVESQTKYVVQPEDTRIKSIDFGKEAQEY